MQKNIKIIIVGVFIFVTLALVVTFSRKESKSEVKAVSFSGDVVISMEEDTYTPTNIEIKKGSKVTFINKSDSLRWPASDLHPSHLIFSDFDPKKPVEIGESWEFVFEKLGEWGYHDHLAPYITGTIKVIE